MKIEHQAFITVECQSEKEREDMIALCELLGFTKYSPESPTHTFAIAPCITVYLDSKRYWQECCKSSIPFIWNCLAADFIKDNF